MAFQTNSFTIAHYILLVCIIVFCSGIVVYAIIHDTGRHDITISDLANHQNVPSEKCIQKIEQAVSKIWTESPDMIPEKYATIAMKYYTAPIPSTFQGNCNGTSFTCKRGMHRNECDPCAIANARDFAMTVQINDMIKMRCNK